jgi:hypothetical protein
MGLVVDDRLINRISAVQPDLIGLPRSCFAGLGPTTSWL